MKSSFLAIRRYMQCGKSANAVSGNFLFWMKNDRINGRKFENSCRLLIYKKDVIVYKKAEIGSGEFDMVETCINASSINIVDSVFFVDKYFIFQETKEKSI